MVQERLEQPVHGSFPWKCPCGTVTPVGFEVDGTVYCWECFDAKYEIKLVNDWLGVPRRTVVPRKTIPAFFPSQEK
ncbi:MAG: hypothetical protein ACFFD4_02400 [Candidatus Odinarchaeota archaeon]